MFSAGINGARGPAAFPGIAGLVQEAIGTAFTDRRDVGCNDRGEVQDVGHRCAVEVAVRLDPVVEDHRVVHGGGQFALGDQGGVGQGVPARSGDLRLLAPADLYAGILLPEASLTPARLLTPVRTSSRGPATSRSGSHSTAPRRSHGGSASCAF